MCPNEPVSGSLSLAVATREAGTVVVCLSRQAYRTEQAITRKSRHLAYPGTWLVPFPLAPNEHQSQEDLGVR